MIKRIQNFIKWAISRFGPATDKEIDFWPFPAEPRPSQVQITPPFEPKPRPQVKKATTRKPKAPVKTVAKKKTKVVKKAK